MTLMMVSQGAQRSANIIWGGAGVAVDEKYDNNKSITEKSNQNLNQNKRRDNTIATQQSTASNNDFGEVSRSVDECGCHLILHQ